MIQYNNRNTPWLLHLLKSCGSDVIISPSAEIKRPAEVSIGSHVAIDSGFYLTCAAELGDYIHIGPHVTCIGGARGLLKMGHFCTIAAGSGIITVSDEHHGYGLIGPTIPGEFRDRVIAAPVVFEMFSLAATNVVIMPGVTLGQGCLVGACSFVTKSLPPWTICHGTPARPVKERPRDRMIEAAKRLGYDVEEDHA